MIEITKDLSKIKRASGRRPALPPELSSEEIKSKADRWLSLNPSPHARHVLDLLATGGVMSAAQLGRVVQARTLREYVQARLLDRLPVASAETVAGFAQIGLQYEKPSQTHLYCLGPVGIEIAHRRHEHPPLTGYLAYTFSRVLHDVLLNEIIMRLSDLAKIGGWSVSWFGEYAASLYADGQQILKPDALLLLKREGEERYYLLEYHNEDWQTRAFEKVKKYEAAIQTEGWKSRWHTETFPPILVVFHARVVGQGYQRAIAERKTVKCQYFGKLLQGVLDNKLTEWHGFHNGERTDIFKF